MESSGSQLTDVTERDEYLPVSAVAELLYCPRNFYYRMVEGATEENEHVLIGRYQEEKRQARQSLTRDGRMQVRSVRVHSASLGLSAVIDVLEFDGGDGPPIPVEYKKGGPPHGEPRLNDQVQVCAQAMLLEESLGVVVPYGYLYYGEIRRRIKVETSAELREQVVRAVEQARRILSSREIPSPVNDSRCNGCSLYGRCLPAESAYMAGEGKEAARNRPRRPTPGVNLGRVLLIDRSGAYVRNTGERITVTVANEKVADVPLATVDEVVTCGRVQFTQPALEALLARGIPLAMMTSTGRLLGFLQPPFSRNGPLRRRQVLAAEVPQLRVKLARAFVVGKLRNMRLTLMRRRRQMRENGEGADRLKQAIARIEHAVSAAERACDCDELLGIEGNGSRAYFEVFDSLLVNRQFRFAGRQRRPPKDPVNALLSFAYTLLTNNATSVLQMVGLDPFIGVYHVNVYGRPALALDLIEEFRPLVADAVVFSVINRRMLTPDDFTESQGGYFLKDGARQKFLEAYTQRLNETVRHPLFGYRVSYRRMLELQARFLAKVVSGELEEYHPLVLR